eukprot:TRINITY_DN3432_c0_g1_i1.p1 TRINITY_DN3432_c0_g1~~TRINITY_DN3432_c0_g1_i1.p1  ORF type:complete len:117 (-),score=15.54 TRINITY_DN3432_c0_g1_i1:26-376(-)
MCIRDRWYQRRVRGLFHDIPNLLYDIRVTPVVGFVQNVDHFIINNSEIADIFTVPIAVLTDPNKQLLTERSYQNKTYKLMTFTGGPHKIWGMTGLITDMFLKEILQNIPLTPGHHL